MIPQGDPGSLKPLRISVALCTHNGQQFIREQITSILNGTMVPHEIVISDDASTDDTLAAARSAFRESGPTVTLQILRNDWPRGVTKNFEQATRACSGEIVVLCDQDDIWLPNRLSDVVPLFASRPELLLVHADAIIVDTTRTPIKRLSTAHLITERERREIAAGNEFNVLMRRRIITGATVAFRRSLLGLAGDFPAEWVHDEWLGVIAAAVGGCDYFPDPITEYRQHGGNQVGRLKLGKLERIGMLLAPGGARNRRLRRRAEQLVERLESLNDMVPTDNLALARRRRDFANYRVGLASRRRNRVGSIVKHVRNRDYAELSRGAKDILLDVLQPLDD